MIIDQLPTVSLPVQNTDEIPIERGQQTFKATIANLNKVSKNGDTITGNLVLKDANIDVTEAPSSTTTTRGIRFTDKNDVVFGTLREYMATSGTCAVQLISQKDVSGTTHSNYLLIGVKSDGSPIIIVADATAWRSALELGSSGAFPITIAQGGTNATSASAARSNLGLGTVAVENKVPIAKGGTGATTAETAVENLGLGSLKAEIISIANGGSGQFSLPNSSRGLIISSGSNVGTKDMFIYNVTSTGAVSYVKMGTSTGLTITTATNKITIANSGGSQTVVCKISY